MSALRARVRRTIERHDLCPPGSRLLVALSGGSDSTALLCLLTDLLPALGAEVAGVVHVHHQLRPTADRDAAFAEALARRLGHAVEVVRVDVAGRAAVEGLSPEDAARRERYEALRAAASRFGATAIATGHTRDDQVETLLMKLARGAGLTGAGGVYPRHGDLVRPLLEASRAELRAELVARGESWVDDESNEDRAILRNRVRHAAVPVLAEVFGEGALDAMAASASLAQEDGQWLDALAAQAAASLLKDTAVGVALDRAGVAALDPPLARRVLLLAMRRHAPAERIRAAHVEEAREVLAGLRRAAESPAGRWELSGANVVLLTNGPAACPEFRAALPVPGSVTWPAGGVVSAQVAGFPGSATPAGDAAGSLETRVRLAEGLQVRTRQPGDVIRLRSGRKKLQDLFVDAKVPRWERDARPVVADSSDTVVWVPGLGVSEAFRVDPAGGEVILLRFSPEGEQA